MTEAVRPTQRQIADLAGLNRATVSLALRNHPRIPEATRRRIQKIADQLGYRPDPMLSALASYRNRRRPKGFQGTLAWLVNNLPPFQWKDVGMFSEYYEGSKKRAALHGYNLEVFHLHGSGSSPEKLASVFRSRNIGGILLCPQPRPDFILDFPWDDFSMVTFGFSLASPRLHTVASTQYRSTLELMQELRERGYRRIGFAFSSLTDQRSNRNFLAGYLVGNELNGGEKGIPRIDQEQATPASFRRWYDRYRPDAVITGNPSLLKIIARAGLRVPRDLGVANPSTWPNHGPNSGIYEDYHEIGSAAVDFLVGLLQQGIHGIPPKPRYIFIPGTWVEGATLRPAAVREGSGAGGPAPRAGKSRPRKAAAPKRRAPAPR